MFSYSIKSLEGWFDIDSNGYISAISPIDREHVSVNQTSNIYILEVNATENSMSASFFLDWLTYTLLYILLHQN